MFDVHLLKCSLIVKSAYHLVSLPGADFGLSNEEFVLDDMGSEVHCRTQCGSPAYAAPELLGQKEYSNAVDVWSM